MKRIATVSSFLVLGASLVLGALACTQTPKADPSAVDAAAAVTTAAAATTPTPAASASTIAITGAAPGAAGTVPGMPGTTIVNGQKSVVMDGGSLNLNNEKGNGSVTPTPTGTVVKGKDGKTIVIPPIPGVK